MERVRVINTGIVELALAGKSSQTVKVIDLDEGNNRILVRHRELTFPVTIDDNYPNVYLDDSLIIYV